MSTETATQDPMSDAFVRLQERLAKHPDFEAIRTSVRRVQSLLSNDTSRTQCVANAVTEDAGLAARLLRLINAAYYKSAGGGTIVNVPRAVAVMGFNAVRNLAVSLRLLEQLPSDRRGRVLREDFLRALLAARLARELCHETRLLEEACVTALFQNLGRMLVAAHLPDEALAIRRQVGRHETPLGAKEDLAAKDRFGLGYADIGVQICKQWGWPEGLRLSMMRGAWPAHPPVDAHDRLRWVGWLANELADVLVYMSPAQWEDVCTDLAMSAGRATKHSAKELREALARTRMDLEDIAEALGIPLSQLEDWHEADAVDGAEGTEGALPRALPAQARSSAERPAPGQVDRAMLQEEALHLSEALLDVSAAKVVPERALSAMFMGLGARRAVLFLAARSNVPFQIVNVVGDELASVGPAWTVDPAQGRDLFSRLCARGTDTLIHDANRPEIQSHLPPGFQRVGRPNCFVVLPMTFKERAVGMIYLDRDDGETFVIDDESMKLLRTLRNQALMALRA